MVAGFVGIAERKEFFGCGGPIRTECAIFEHTVPQRIDPFRRVSLRTKRLHAWFPLAGNPGASPQDRPQGRLAAAIQTDLPPRL